MAWRTYRRRWQARGTSPVDFARFETTRSSASVIAAQARRARWQGGWVVATVRSLKETGHMRDLRVEAGQIESANPVDEGFPVRGRERETVAADLDARLGEQHRANGF
jgi:hypothetical protein